METLTLLRLAETFCAHDGRKLSTISTYASGDGKKLSHLKKGGGCTVRVAMRMLDWFDANWPADLAWPADIQRPSCGAKSSRARRAA
ncbi:MAG: hypothetical protein MUE52_04210 [Tabrizicola sp.]|nr:hypothetical protein [Tabrizicola sp.]